MLPSAQTAYRYAIAAASILPSATSHVMLLTYQKSSASIISSTQHYITQ